MDKPLDKENMNQAGERLFNESTCLSLDMLTGYLENTLASSNMQYVEKHLIDCELCTAALEGITIMPERNSLKATIESLNYKIIGNKAKLPNVTIPIYAKRIIAAAAIILMVLGAGYFFDYYLHISDQFNPIAESTQVPAADKEPVGLEQQAKLSEPVEDKTNRAFERIEPYREDYVTQRADEATQEVEQDAFALDGKGIIAALSPDVITYAWSPTSEIDEIEANVYNNALSPSLAYIITVPEEKVIGGDQDGYLLADNIPAEDFKEKNEVLAEPTIAGESKRRKSVEENLSKQPIFSKDETSKNDGSYDFGASSTASGVIGAADTVIVSGTAVNLDYEESIFKEQEISEPDFFYVVEDMPEFPGGRKSMEKFIKANIKYPENGKKGKNKGTVSLSFIVDEDGKVTNVKITKSSGILELDQDAVRVVRSMPDWTAGKESGVVQKVKQSVKVKY
ncbi:MAG: energy transducer TonB [Bacteroidetes bacterium]|nr:energy transducer TonB [Bacteroidota bacterium]